MLIGVTTIGDIPGIGDSYTEQTISYTMDQWTIFAGSEPIEGGKIRYTKGRSAGLNIQKTVPKAYQMGYAISTNNVFTHYWMDVGLKDTLRSIETSLSLVPSYESTIPSTSVLNALVWTWAETFDAVWRTMDTMATALKIDSATGTYLDEAWGQIYDMPRIYLETDSTYRDRLKSRTSILMSSGTIANCEAIIDSIVGEIATNVTTQYPASVIVTFDTIEAMRKATAKKTLLESLIPNMLAAGITYKMFMPYADYNMDTYMKGPLTLSCAIAAALNHHNEDTTYLMDIINNIQTHLAYDNDTLLMMSHIVSLAIKPHLANGNTKTFLNKVGLFGTIRKATDFNTLNKKFAIVSSIIMDSYFQKYNVEKSFNIDMINQATKKRMYGNSITSVLQHLKTTDQDIVIRLYGKSFDIDLCNQRTFPKRQGMVITLVGA